MLCFIMFSVHEGRMLPAKEIMSYHKNKEKITPFGVSSGTA